MKRGRKEVSPGELGVKREKMLGRIDKQGAKGYGDQTHEAKN